MKTITIKPTDDRYTVREILRRVDDDRVLVMLPWDVERGWSQPLDYEVQRRAAQRRRLQMAWVIEDPVRRGAARMAGLPVFSSESAAREHLERNGASPAIEEKSAPEPPPRPWYAPAPQRPKAEKRERPSGWLLFLEGAVLVGVLAVVLAALALVVPSARITLHPTTLSYSRIVPISVDPEAEVVDLQRGVVPSQRIGEEFEGYAEVVTSGRGYAFSGTATGRVLFTNLLGQDYPVPAGTVVRTSAGSYPVRYKTTGSVTVPAFGQAEAPVSALVEGPRGNVDAFQINFVEGVAGFAVRVTNPEPITGAESQTVRIVAQEDRDRAWELASQQVMAQAYNGLQELAAQQKDLFLPRQTLMIQAAPKAAYTHVVGEQSDVLGLSLRLLVTGEAISSRDVQAVAYHRLAAQLPEGYTLTDARFGYGEAAEEDIGPGRFTFFVTAHGYASAKIDMEVIQESILGTPVSEAEALLQDTLPLSQPPEIEVTPSWFPYIPFLPIRTEINVATGHTSS